MQSHPAHSPMEALWKLLTLACLAMLVEGALSEQFLPSPSQQGNRVLAVIHTYDPASRHEDISRQLQHYTQMCERGYEVHVVLALNEAGVKQFTQAHKPSDYFCSRLESQLAVAILGYPVEAQPKVQPGQSLKWNAGQYLSARHRQIFEQYSSIYDMFISQADSIEVELRHVLYWKIWNTQLRGSQSIPSFIEYEVVERNSSNRQTTNKTQSAMVVKDLTDWGLALVSISGERYLAPVKAHSTLLMLSREQLARALLHPDYKRYDTPGQGTWLRSLYANVIPLAAVRQSLVRSWTTSPAPVAQNSTGSGGAGSQSFLSDVKELLYLLSHCTLHREDGTQFTSRQHPLLAKAGTQIIYSSPGDASLARQQAPCLECLARGKAAHITVHRSSFGQTTPRGRPQISLHVKVACVQGLAPQHFGSAWPLLPSRFDLSYAEFLEELRVAVSLRSLPKDPFKHLFPSEGPPDDMPETPCEGAWLEFGVFIGVTINQTAKYQQRACKQGGTLPVYGFDTFTGLPEAWRPGFAARSFDMGGNLPKVPANVQLVKGLFNETLPGVIRKLPANTPVTYVNVDCDLYGGSIYTLVTLNSLMKPGAIIHFDELINYPGWAVHEVKAMYEWQMQYKRRVWVLGAQIGPDPRGAMDPTIDMKQEHHMDRQAVVVMIAQ